MPNFVSSIRSKVIFDKKYKSCQFSQLYFELNKFNITLLAFLLLFCLRSSAVELPAEISRFNPAGLSTEWEYQGSAFLALDKSDAEGTSVHVYRLHHPQRGYIFTTNKLQAVEAGGSGFISEGIAFDVPVKSRLPVFRFKNSANDSYLYTTNLDEGNHAGFVNEGTAFYAYDPESKSAKKSTTQSNVSLIIKIARYQHTSSGLYLLTGAKETPYQIGVYYFGSFTHNAQSIIDGTARVYGRQDDWWGGVKDFYGHESGVRSDNRGWPGEYSYLKPAIGYYNQESPSTLEKQIRQASDAGLSFFSFYWYWSNKSSAELYGESLHSFLKASNSRLMKFNLSLYAHPWNDDMAIDSSNTLKIIHIFVNYFAQPNYLRLPDGRPVFVIGDQRNIRDVDGKKCGDTQCSIDATQRFITLLKEVSLKTIGVVPFVQIQAGAPGWNAVPGVDGVTCLVPPQLKIEGETLYPQIQDNVFTSLSNAHKPISPCMLENFDERPRQDILIKDRAKVRHLVGKTNALFRHNLSVTKHFSDLTYAQEQNPASRIIYLYAWNEWHEGGIIEPNVQTGAQDLNIVTDVFQLPRSSSLCLDKGTC